MAARAETLAKKFDAKVLAGMPPLSAAQLAEGYLVGHIDEHLGSIRATVGS